MKLLLLACAKPLAGLIGFAGFGLVRPMSIDHLEGPGPAIVPEVQEGGAQFERRELVPLAPEKKVLPPDEAEERPKEP